MMINLNMSAILLMPKKTGVVQKKQLKCLRKTLLRPFTLSFLEHAVLLAVEFAPRAVALAEE